MDKVILLQIALSIHFILMGIMLFRLFKLKNAKGGHVIIALVLAIFPILGPFGLILYFNSLIKKEEKLAAAPQRGRQQQSKQHKKSRK